MTERRVADFFFAAFSLRLTRLAVLLFIGIFDACTNREATLIGLTDEYTLIIRFPPPSLCSKFQAFLVEWLF